MQTSTSLEKEIKIKINNLASLTSSRTKNAFQMMTSAARRFYETIPVLLHYNHPLLPGYIPGNTPHGICGFKLSEKQRDYIDRMVSVTNCNIDIHSSETAIVSLYAMGSTSSVGQNRSSDIDIWVCHSTDIGPKALELLEEKCKVISNFAQSSNVDLNFFLVPTDKFRKENLASVDSENCGTALHLLLLEEFYRTSLWMAGKKLVWYLVPEYEETIKYDEYVEMLFQEKLVLREDWFDLGPISSIPGQEFLGSALWLMYKGVDYPYKAVLKILLMEVYAYEYPNVKLIANEIKSRINEISEYDLSVDAYNQVYLKIRNYLEAINDHERLKMLHKCFYQKVFEGISPKEYELAFVTKRELAKELNELSKKYGLTETELSVHTHRNNWNIAVVNKSYDSVFKTLLISYNKLKEFSEKVDALGSISSRDLSVLSRKLSSAFDKKEDKIIKVNLNMAPNIGERNISLIYVDKGKLNRSGWYLYPSSLNAREIIRYKCAYFHKNLVNVLLWSFLNKILLEDTKINFAHSHISELEDKVKVINNILYSRRNRLLNPVITGDDLINPCYCRSALVLINVEKDASRETDKNEIDFSNVDVLSFGRDNRSLIACLDLISMNSWGELFVKHYDGDNGVIAFLEDVLNSKNSRTGDFNDTYFDVFCFSKYLSGVIRQQIYDLIVDAMHILSNEELIHNHKVFMLGGTSYSILENHKKVTIVPLKNTLDFINILEDSQQEQEEHKIRNPGVELIYQFATEGILQFFFEDLNEGYRVYILDERNKLMKFIYLKLSKESFVTQINRKIYEDKENSTQKNTEKFNLPQFYQLSNTEGVYEIYPYNQS